MKEELVIVGAGGHAKVILDILIENDDYNIYGCLDNSYKEKKLLLDVPIVGDDSFLDQILESGIKNAFIALGDNKLRHKLYVNLKSKGFNIINAISKKAILSTHLKIGSGVAIMPGAIINAGVTIGNNAIINTKASLDHDVFVGDNAHIAPGVTVSGYSKVDEGTFLGTGSSVIDKINIGKWSIIGGGSVVVKDIPDNCLAYGVPASVIKRLK